jgi:hypothetical protein
MFNYIVTFFRENDLRGSEASMMVVFTNFIDGQHNDNVFSRCTSSLIVVCNQKSADMIFPDSEQYSFAYKINIQGKIIVSLHCKNPFLKLE